MPAITASSLQGSGQRTLTETTLNGTDSFVYNAAKNPILTLRNATAGALSPVIDGDGNTPVQVPGLGYDVGTSSGYPVGSIAAAAHVVIPLATISLHLKGTIAITGGTGLVATLMEY